ncbi:hypothetical protein Lal_00039007, partial [Lupinus albus]
ALTLTSTTFVSAIYNLIPAITFILAISCSLEKLNLRATTGKSKVLGTLIGIGGAMFLTFYKGIKINIWPFHINLLHLNGHVILLHDDSNNKLVGDLCGIASCFSYALRVIIQVSLIDIFVSYSYYHVLSCL